MTTINKLHFANFFNVAANPSTDMLNGELAFDSTYRMVYKDQGGVLHYLPGVDDYANIYSPATITITQTAKDSTIGVGTEGNYSSEVTMAIPYAFTITATDIHERQMLVQYNASNTVKDVLVLPEYFCKLDTVADVFDVNKGIMTEYVRKSKIVAHLGRTALTNNAIFKILLLDTTTVATTLGYAFTTEANKDNASYRDQFYVGADGYLYLIKNITTTDLTYPFWVFNKRTSPVSVRLGTKYFLFERGDKFSMKTYRAFSGNAVDTSYQFIGASETITITGLLLTNKTTPLRVSAEPLAISSDSKSVLGLDGESYYDIVVSTSEIKVNPTISYKILDISDGFFNYLYQVIKNVSDNGSGMGATVINGSTGKKYLFEYTYTALADGITTFTIPAEFYSVSLGDREILSMKGVILDKGVDYTVDASTGNIVLNFAMKQGEAIHSFIFKYVDKGGEAYLISSLQNYINTIDTNLASTKLAMNVMAVEVPKYNLIPNSGRFYAASGGQQDFTIGTTTAPTAFFKSHNGATITDIGKFINDNTTNAGTAGDLPQAVIDLLAAMPVRKQTVTARRYGPEFRVIQIVGGNGTDNTYGGKYLMVDNNSVPLYGPNGWVTFSAWLRLSAGTTVIIKKPASGKLLLNAVEQSTDLTLTTAMGWVHVEVTASLPGFDTAFPYLYGAITSTIQMALPVIVPGRYGVGIHEYPILSIQ